MEHREQRKEVVCVLQYLVSLVLGILANAIWSAIERASEHIRTRKNPPRSDQGE